MSNDDHNAAATVLGCGRLVRSSFVRAMADEIEANERKGPWDQFVPRKEYVKPWMEEHTAKLYAALEAGDSARVREHCADVANIAMKIEEHFGPNEKAQPRAE